MSKIKNFFYSLWGIMVKIFFLFALQSDANNLESTSQLTDPLFCHTQLKMG